MKPTNNIPAVIIRLHVGQFKNSYVDKEMTADVLEGKNMNNGAGAWRKNKFPKSAFRQLSKYAGFVRTWSYQHTLPWEFGYRLLTTKNYDAYHAKISEFQREYAKLASAFGNEYGAWIEAAKAMHRTHFRASDYPSWPAMAGEFVIRLDHAPMPKAEHFALRGIAAKAVSDMRVEMQERVNKNVQEAMADTWHQLLEPVQHMVAILADDDTKVFRDSLVDNVRDIIARTPGLNLINDSKLTGAVAAIKNKIDKINLDTLKKDVLARKIVAAEVHATIAGFEQLGKRKFVVGQ